MIYRLFTSKSWWLGMLVHTVAQGKEMESLGISLAIQRNPVSQTPNKP